jgi:putative salt-induced outer membrane protein YdiY
MNQCETAGRPHGFGCLRKTFVIHPLGVLALACCWASLSPAQITGLELTQADNPPGPIDLPGPIDIGLDLPSPPAATIDTPELPRVPPEVIGSGTAEPDESAAESIGEAIQAGESAEVPPLAEETSRWYMIPWRWLTEGWNNHAELGLDGSSGNARTLAFQTGVEMKRNTEDYTIAVDFDYRKASNRETTTEDNGRFNIDYDRLLKDSPWSGFGKFGMEWDQFKAFDLRVNVNGGLGYYFLRSDAATFATRFGAGASQEIGAPDDSWKPEAVFGAEAEYQWNRYHKMKGKFDYFPAWADFSDYRIVTDAAWEILLDDSDNLSLKLAVTDRYDSTPQGARPNDVYYSLLLLVKF